MKTSVAIAVVMIVGVVLGAWGQEPPPAPSTPPAASAAPDVQHPAAAQHGMVDEPITPWLMLKWGGAILWVTLVIGFVGLTMAIYLILTLTPNREAPPVFAKRALGLIRSGDLRGAYQLCEESDYLLANVIRAGLKVSGHDRYVIQEAMESEGERGATALWQKISYLNNIGTIAPLLGLLGTVWGMLLAFSNIAAENAQVKGIVVAANVSKAMITTVGGLVVAIPAICVYYFLRGRVVKVVAAVEAQASEVVELLSRGKES